MENKLKHLEMIQNVINRMAGNSFMIKGWSVVIISALFALAANGTNVNFVYFAFFPAIVFWILDGYFLWQERCFRALYDGIRVLENNKIDFSMDTRPYSAPINGWFKTIFSKTLVIFHAMILISIIAVIIIL